MDETIRRLRWEAQHVARGKGPTAIRSPDSRAPDEVTPAGPVVAGRRGDTRVRRLQRVLLR